MINEAFETEGAALDLYRRASLDPARESGAIRLALGLNISVRFVPLQVRARLVANDNAIELRTGLSIPAAEYFAGHELAHWSQRVHACGDPRVERVCDAIGSAIVVPRPALYLMRMVMGYDVARIASTLDTTVRLVALRWGEVFDEPIALIEPRRVLRAGPTMCASDVDLRRIARAGNGEGARVIRLGASTMVIFES